MSPHPSGQARKSPGDGCIVQRKDGRWQGSLQVDGRRATVYGKARAEAASKLKDLRRKATVEGGLPSNATLRELLDRWLEAESPRWAARTLSDYRHLVDDVITPSLGNARLAKLTPDRLQTFYNAVAKRSVHEASYCHRVLRRALHVATMWGYLPTNPCDRVARPPYRPSAPTLWTPDQVGTFLEASHDDWLGPFFEAALHLGCRPGEMVALRWGDLADGTLRVERAIQRIRGEWVETTPKTMSGRRTLSVSPALAVVLKRQKVQQNGWRLRAGPKWEASDRIFTSQTGGILSPGTAGHALHRLADPLGLPRIGLHKLRHLSASLALQGGIPLPMVSRRLGHSSVAITASVYSHCLTGDEQAADALARALARQG